MVLFNDIVGTFRKRCTESIPSAADARAIGDLSKEVGQVMALNQIRDDVSVLLPFKFLLDPGHKDNSVLLCHGAAQPSNISYCCAALFQRRGQQVHPCCTESDAAVLGSASSRFWCLSCLDANSQRNERHGVVGWGYPGMYHICMHFCSCDLSLSLVA